MAYPIIDVCIGEYVMRNGQLLYRCDPEAAGLFKPSTEVMFYEVVRIVDGVPLFWTDHLNRLITSTAGKISVPTGLADQAARLIRANWALISDDEHAERKQANLRLVLTETSTVLHLTPSYYPNAEMIHSGVPTGILCWEREEPNIKRISSPYKAAVAAGFARKGPYGTFFELILQDRQGWLMEGSRSNFFVLSDTHVFTAPDDRILLGITRRHVRTAIEQAGLHISERLFRFEDLIAAPELGAFLSGSPIDLLPIRSLEHHLFNMTAGTAFQSLREAYLAIAEDDLTQSRAQFDKLL